MLTTLSLLITISLYVFPACAQVSTNGTKTWLDRENNIKILFRTIPEQPTIGTTSTLRFTVQNLQTGKPVTNLLASVVIVGGTEAPIPFPNISAVNGDISIDMIFTRDRTSYYKDNIVTNSRCCFISIVYSYSSSPSSSHAICFEPFWQKLYYLGCPPDRFSCRGCFIFDPKK